MAQNNGKFHFTPMNMLDNIVWHSLTTRQAEFAEVCGEARRFPPEVTLLAGFSEPSDRNFESLADLVGPEGVASIFQDTPFHARPGWKLAANPPAFQMVQDNPHPETISQTNNRAQILTLGAPDSQEMLELAKLTKPGPFGLRTHELGKYVGIRENGKLVAMAGERMRIPGYIEVSAVCTHPDHIGRGYAALLMNFVMEGIRDRGEIPILHVRQENVRAIKLYERLGFRTRKEGYFAFLRRE